MKYLHWLCILTKVFLPYCSLADGTSHLLTFIGLATLTTIVITVIGTVAEKYINIGLTAGSTHLEKWWF